MKQYRYFKKKFSKVILLTIFIMLVTSCSLGDYDAMLNNEVVPTATAEVLKNKDLNLLSSEQLLKKYPNMSFDVYKLKNNKAEHSYSVKVLQDEFTVTNYEDDEAIKTTAYSLIDDSYFLLNHSVGSMFTVTNEDYNKSERNYYNLIIKPETFLNGNYYYISDYKKFIEDGKAMVNNLEGIKYKVLDENDNTIKILYISDKYNFVVRVDDLLSNESYFVDNIILGNVKDEDMDIADSNNKFSSMKEDSILVEGEDMDSVKSDEVDEVVTER